MIKFQIQSILRRREFRFVFLFTMTIASVYPIYLTGLRSLQHSDIGTVCDPRYAFLFYQHSDIINYLPLMLPILSMFPTALIYAIDKKTRYNHLIVSRSGIKSYLIQNAITAIISGFFIIFIPSLWNITINYAFLPRTNCAFEYSDYYNEILDSANSYILSSRLHCLWLYHPFLSDIYSAIRAAILSSVVSLVTYVTEIYFEPKYCFVSIVPSIALLYTGNYLQSIFEPTLYSFDLITYICSDTCVYGTFVFWILISILLIVSFILITYKAKKDMIS